MHDGAHVVAGDGGRPPAVRRRAAAPRRPRAGRGAGLLPALPVRRRLGHARRAGAQVLAGLVSRGGARGPDREASSTDPTPRPARRWSACSWSAPATSGRRSPPSTTAAWSRCSSSTRRWTRSSTRAREMVVSLDPARRGEGGAPAGRAGEAVPHPGALRRARDRGWASTRARCWRAPGTRPRRSPGWRSRAPWPARPRTPRGASWHELGQRPAPHGRAGRGQRSQRGHDQALPARGPAARAGEDLAQHVLVPARSSSSASG